MDFGALVNWADGEQEKPLDLSTNKNDDCKTIGNPVDTKCEQFSSFRRETAVNMRKEFGSKYAQPIVNQILQENMDEERKGSNLDGEFSHALYTYGKIFPQKGLPQTHSHTGYNGIKHTCKICGQTYKKIGSLNRHIQAMHSSSNTHYYTGYSGYRYNGIKFTCGICGEILSNVSNLKRHVRVVHLGVEISCSKCGKVFARNDLLKDHVESVHNVKTYTCDFCGKLLVEGKGVAHHVNKFHFQKNYYGCGSGEKTYSRSSDLDRHIESYHFGTT